MSVDFTGRISGSKHASGFLFGSAMMFEYNFLMNLRFKARYSPWPLCDKLVPLSRRRTRQSLKDQRGR